MIKNLPELPKKMRKHPFAAEWRRVAGKHRAMFLISKDAYNDLLDGTLATEKERDRALKKLISYSYSVGWLDPKNNTFNLTNFVHDEELWND